MKLWIILILSMLPLLPVKLEAQVEFESSQGTSSIVLNEAGILAINFADTNIKFGYNRIVSTSPWRLGFEVKYKTTEGFVTLFDGRKFSLPETSALLFFGRSWGPSGDTLLYQILGVHLEYKNGYYNLAQTDGDNSISLVNTIFHGISGKVFYNAFCLDFILPGETYYGISVSYGRRNNYQQLNRVEVCNTATSSSNGNFYNTIQSCKDARVGDYRENDKVTVDFDILWYQKWAKSRIAFSLLGRFDGMKDDNPFSPGVGVFLTKNGSPKIMLGGFTIEYVDEKIRMGLQVGYPFNTTKE